DFWNASSIGAGIMDEEGVIHYKSRHSIPVCEEQIRNAEKQAVILENGKYILRSHRIRGGFCYWTKDVSEINKLNQMLTDTGNVLAEENAMLEAENKMLEEQTGIRQQNSLYDSIARKVKPQLEKISRLIDEPVQEETLFIEKMKYACILNSYVKRCSNLLLMSHQADKIDSDELRLAISESLEYVRLYGIKAYGAYRGKRLFPADNILLAYEVFEAILESAIPGTGAMLLDMEIDDAGLLLHMEINAPKRIFAGEQLLDRIEVQGGRFSIETEQQTEYVSLMLPFGGDER
ncbi:MAG: hypothetical protein ACI4EF_09555, partial [Coprococcus sp.]